MDRPLQAMQDLSDCLDSLEEAIEQSGGANTITSISSLKEMSALEMLMKLAPNKIRFHYSPNLDPHEVKIEEKKYENGVR